MNKTFAPVLLGLLTIALPSMAEDKWDISKLDAAKLPAPAAQSPVTFDKDIKPVFERSCVKCHNGERQKGGLRLDSLEAVMKGGKAGKMVVSGDSAKSLLVLAVSQQDKATAMPPQPRKGPGGPPAGFGRGPTAPQENAPPGGPLGGAPAGGPPPGGFGPPAKPLTTEQVALVRAWIDQGAK